MYINDLCNVADNGKFILFADDTNIFVAADSKSAAYITANGILSSVQNYMKCNLLHINKKKCCYIYFPPKKCRNSNENLDELYLSIDGTIRPKHKTQSSNYDEFWSRDLCFEGNITGLQVVFRKLLSWPL